jgi:hypothetical protein
VSLSVWPSVSVSDLVQPAVVLAAELVQPAVVLAAELVQPESQSVSLLAS